MLAYYQENIATVSDNNEIVPLSEKVEKEIEQDIPKSIGRVIPENNNTLHQRSINSVLTIQENTFSKKLKKSIKLDQVISFRKKIEQDQCISLQKWEGYVLEVNEIVFKAHLADLNLNDPDEETELPIEEVSPEDIDLLKPGAIFYWSIGYFDKLSGQRQRYSELRFQRIPKWSKEELKIVKNKADELNKQLKWGK